MKRKTKEKRNYNVRLIRKRRSYTMSELGELLHVHVRTVQSWRRQGMAPIDLDDRPWLFIGSEIQRFLSQKQKAKKCPIKEDEFFCPRCRTARTSLLGDVYLEDTGRKMGKADILMMIRGKCTICECRLTRFSTRSALEKSFWVRKLRQGQATLSRDRKTTVNTDLEGGGGGTD